MAVPNMKNAMKYLCKVTYNDNSFCYCLAGRFEDFKITEIEKPYWLYFI
jgi:hypothetical protein